MEQWGPEDKLWANAQTGGCRKTVSALEEGVSLHQWLDEACCSGAQSCLTLCDPVDCSTPGLPVLQHHRSLLKLMSIELVIDSEAWRAAVHGVQSRTRLSN